MYIINNEDSFKEFNSMVESGEASIIEIKNNLLKAKVFSDIIDIEIGPLYLSKFDNTSRVINGKDDTKNIVNISIKDGYVYIFTETNGVINCTKKIYTHWVLSPKVYPGYSALKGNEYFKYIKDYDVRDFERVRSNVYRQGLYTINNYSESYMVKNGLTYFKGMKVTDVSILSFDIETTGTNPNADDACVLVITNAFRKNNIVIKKTFTINDFSCEADMIANWVDWVYEIDPSVICGHNITMFDIPYIKARADKAELPLHLGRNGEIIEIEERTREFRKDGSQSYTYNPIKIFGREIVDTFFLSIKADIARKYESYALKQIIKQEGLEKENRQHYDASKIRDNWNILEERAKIIQYAEDDAEDPIKLYDLMIAPFFYSTMYVPKTFQAMIESATGSQINSLMVRSYLQDGYSVAKASEGVEFEGAVSLGNTGIYQHAMKWDVASLYPSIMRYYKIFPKGKDYNNNFLKMLEYFTLDRLKNKQLAKETKERLYKDLEQTAKVFINSAYGFMGASGLNYNYPPGAAEVTRRGRDIITRATEWATGQTLEHVLDHITNEGKPTEEKHYKWVLGAPSKEFKGKGFTLVNGDTDSITVTDYNSFVSKEQREVYLSELNSIFPSMIRWEDDGYYDTVCVLKAKNYIMRTEDGKVKLKGSSLKTQQKETAMREMLKKMIEVILE